MKFSVALFQQAVLDWFEQHGRKNLPWQKPASPYRVWVSEIMLQQTQVTTVIPYFERFIKHFPTIKHLAHAAIDDVLNLWAGLGYYARARYLHRTAQIIQHEYAGKFPTDLEILTSLPGIGRSTAGAILSLSKNLYAAILDGNVKRVLTRVHAIEGWPSETSTLKKLWELAERYTSHNRPAHYTQAMMDLGATICTRSKPKCLLCPLQKFCIAFKQGNPNAYPTKKPKKQLPVRIINMLVLRNQAGEILLEKRPPVGIWGGLWSLPECPVDADITAWCKEKYACFIGDMSTGIAFRHTFSHFHLDIVPIIVTIKSYASMIKETQTAWHNNKEINTKGLATPIKKLLSTLNAL